MQLSDQKLHNLHAKPILSRQVERAWQPWAMVGNSQAQAGPGHIERNLDRRGGTRGSILQRIRDELGHNQAQRNGLCNLELARGDPNPNRVRCPSGQKGAGQRLTELAT